MWLNFKPTLVSFLYRWLQQGKQHKTQFNKCNKIVSRCELDNKKNDTKDKLLFNATTKTFAVKLQNETKQREQKLLSIGHVDYNNITLYFVVCTIIWWSVPSIMALENQNAIVSIRWLAGWLAGPWELAR